MHEMKDSGIAWLGNIDKRFELKTIGNLFSIKKEIIGHDPDQVLSITQKGIKIKDTTSNEGQNAASYTHYQIVNIGDFAMNHMDLLTGWVDISNYQGVTSPDYRVFTLSDKKQNPEYFLRVFQMYYANRVFYAFGQGAASLGRWRLPRENFLKIAIPCPPMELQKKINSRINEKVCSIDALIANQQKQIEKLKQYRQSLITEVVKKGLNTDITMKDSGIEWIGNIAKNHSVFRLKFLLNCPMMYGSNESGSQDSQDSVRYIRITDITTDSQLKNDENNVYLQRTIAKDYLLKDDDVLFARSGGTVGKSFIYHSIYGESAFAGYLIKAECNHEMLLAEYLFYYTQSSLYEQWKNMIFIQSTIQNIGANKYSNMEIVIPPIDMQRRIVDYLKEKCDYIDNLINIKAKKIKKLNQYKQSIIYEYVTGKKEV